jgi:CxxC-x17-CxxC domain-containing protein
MYWVCSRYHHCYVERHGPDRKRRGAAGREVTILATDQTLRCRECGRDFVFTVGEQEFYASKGLVNTPSRCPECRAARKSGMSGGYGQDRAPRQMYTATCSSCGGEARVPFQPRGDKPVYCSNCFQQIGGGARSGGYGSARW